MEIIPISEDSFADFGRYYDLNSKSNALSDECEIYITKYCPMQRPLCMGLAIINGGKKIEISQMERHLSTEEIIICAEGTLIMPVALGDVEKNPQKYNIKLFVLHPGDVAVVNAGVWHAVCQPLNGRTVYYPMAHSDGNPSEYYMHPVEPEPMVIDLEKEVLMD